MLFPVLMINRTIAPFAAAVGIYHGTCNLFGSGRHHHFVSALVFGQNEDRVRGVSAGGAMLRDADLTERFLQHGPDCQYPVPLCR